MLGCAPVLEQRLGSRLRVDAVVGRQAADTIERIAEYRAEGALPRTVIVQLGDNGPVWYANMQRLRSVLSGVQHVVIVNVRVARDWQNEVNSELASYVSTWPQAVLANWYSHSSESLLVDGVHPSVPGRAIYAASSSPRCAKRRRGGGRGATGAASDRGAARLRPRSFRSSVPSGRRVGAQGTWIVKRPTVCWTVPPASSRLPGPAWSW